MTDHTTTSSDQLADGMAYTRAIMQLCCERGAPKALGELTREQPLLTPPTDAFWYIVKCVPRCPPQVGQLPELLIGGANAGEIVRPVCLMNQVLPGQSVELRPQPTPESPVRIFGYEIACADVFACAPGAREGG